MTSREELIAELERRDLIAQLEARDSSRTVQSPELGGVDTARGAIESFNQGTTLGFGDEIVGGIRAAIDPLIGAAAGEEGVTEGYFDNFGDRYRMYREDQEGVQKQFASENPVTATALEIGGAIASPANYARLPALLGKTALTKTLGRADELIAPAGKWAERAEKIRPLAGALGRAAAEGGIYGAGTADEGERLEGATKGATTGALFTGALKGAGNLGGRLVKDRLPEKLGSGEDFISLNLASEGALGDFYRDFVGRSWGGARKILEQSAPTMGKVARIAERAAEKKAGVVSTLAREKEALASTAKKMVDDAGEPFARRAEDLASAAKKIEPAPPKVSTEDFNIGLLRESAPAGYREGITDIGELGFQQMNKAVKQAYDDAWEGIRIPANKRKATSDAIESIKGELDEAGKAKLTRFQKELSKDGLSAQQIDQAIRELIPSTGGSTQDILNSIRASLRKELPKSRQKILSAADDVYPNNLALNNAGAQATRRTGSPVFEAKDVVRGGATVGGKKATTEGVAPLLDVSGPRLKETLSNKASAKSAKAAIPEEIKKLRRAAASAKKKAKSKAKILKRTADRKARGKLDAASAAEEVANARKAAVKKLLPPDPEDISGLSGALTTETFSPWRTGYRALNLLSGSALSRGLGSQTVQRTLAGQSAMQEAIARKLRETEAGRELLRAGLSRYSSGQAGE